MRNIDKVLKEKEEQVKEYIIKNSCPHQFDLEKLKICNGIECVRCWNKEVE
ncbi:MAG: hypothetical protein ACRCX2_37730 [Paraclostridium sp.]